MNKPKSSNKIIIIVAHPDDAELSMGMTIRDHILKGDEVKIVVLSKGGNRGLDIENIRINEVLSAGKELGLNEENYIFGKIADTKFFEQRLSVRKFLEEIIKEYKPQILYTHYEHDYHLDHEITSAEALIAGRSVPNIYYFRSPYTRDFKPNKFLFKDANFYKFKDKALRCFKSQALLDVDIIKKLSNVEYVGILHPNLLANIFMSHGTKDLYYESFVVLRELS
jgi:LmbE family N-acetylglucosaminyl deacetylase